MESHRVRVQVIAHVMTILFMALVIQCYPTSVYHEGFYNQQCPSAEQLVQRAVYNAIDSDVRTAAGLLRLYFHDCFVEGCDASLLIDESNPKNPVEQDALPNKGTLHGFDVIDAAKSCIEAECPGVVSCADILAFAVRDSVVKLGGPYWGVKAGRRDGTTSSVIKANRNIPSPFSNVSTLTKAFAAKGLSQDQMITLSGAHTIGVSHCSSFTPRLYNFSSTEQTDPSLDPTYAESLKILCPRNFSANTITNLDPRTPISFDNSYYINLKNHQGLFTSDQVLLTDPATHQTVIENAQYPALWRSKFASAMIAIGDIDLKVGTKGEIRKHCSIPNPKKRH